MSESVPADFASFVSQHYDGLVRAAYLLVGDRGHAEDLVQSALATTFKAWHRIEADAAGAYTRTVMIRLAGRWSRRLWRNELSSEYVPDRESRSSRYSDERLDLQCALQNLPVRQRAVLVLRYFEDRSETETAQILGCSVGTVKSRAHRGLAALRASGLLEIDQRPEVHRG